MNDGLDRRPLIAAGTLLGVGMGGFVDGILFHQILQLHNMLSAKYPRAGVAVATALVNVEVNMFWDGLFHAGERLESRWKISYNSVSQCVPTDFLVICTHGRPHACP
jgi:uncharacterized membrane protein